MKHFMLIFISFLTLSSYTSAEEIVIIVNLNNHAVVNNHDVKKIFMGKSTSFSNGKKAIPINLEEGAPARIQFNKEYIGKKQSQLNAYWARLEFSGKALPPEEKTVDEVLQMVKNNVGAISYMERARVTTEVKIVQ